MKKIVQHETLSDQAYRIIKQAITDGKLKDKESLPEEKLAKNLGISRTPLRDAFARLAAEGLIIQQKGAPAIVASFTKKDSLEYMELRSLLEVYNIEKVTVKMHKETIEKLQENLVSQRAAINENKYHEFIELDRDFHLLLAACNDNEEIKKVIHRMNTGVSRAFLILSSTVPKSAEDAYEEHQEIIKALEQKDVVAARNSMLIHMNNVQKRFLSYYDHAKNKN